MLPSVNYPNPFPSPSSPLVKANSKATKANVTFSGVGHEPDVFDSTLSSKPKVAPTSCSRLDLQA